MRIEDANRTACAELDRRVDLSPQYRSWYQSSGRRTLAAMRRCRYSINFAGLCEFAESQSYARSTIHQYRTHLRYAMAERLIKRLADADRCRLWGRLTAAEVAEEEVERLGDGLATLVERHSNDELPEPARQDPDTDLARDALIPAQQHAQERGYQDWRLDLLRSAGRRKNDKRFEPMLIQSCSGCRPEEMRYGVRVMVADGGQAVRMRVAGAKVDDVGVRGQPWRELTVRPGPSGAGLVGELMDYTQRRGGDITVRLRHNSADPVASYCQSVWRLAHRLGYEVVSAYTLRHQFAADCKADSVPIERLARALGHTTPRAQHVYGRRDLGGTGLISLVDEEAERPIRRPGRGPEADDDVDHAPRPG